MGKQKVSLTVNEREHLPRAEVSYQFKSSAGTVKVNITTAGENYSAGDQSRQKPHGRPISLPLNSRSS
jgi:archaellum component FlaF (FlaF/FlaG flagellin family)